MDKSGVYMIYCLSTKQIYIGSAAGGIAHRFAVHKHRLNKNIHGNYKLQRAWNSYKANAFICLPLEYTDPIDCVSREQYYMYLLKPELNIRLQAKSNLGLKASEETKRKSSIAHKGQNTWSRAELVIKM